MSPAPLLRHHAGRMAGPARWYLAALAAISLGLLAAHFSVQEHVQKSMRNAVHDWMQQSGGSVQHVRFRLLRGALTLEKVHWVDADDPAITLDADQVFIRTSSRAMLSPNPRFSLLRFGHPVLHVRRAALLGWLRGDSNSPLHALSALLAHAHAVVVRDMSLSLTGGDAAVEPLLQQVQGGFTADGMHFDGFLGVGLVLVDGHTDTDGVLRGRIALRGVSLASLLLAAPAGTSVDGGVTASGDLALQGSWPRRDVGMHGVLRLQDNTAASGMAVRGGWSAAGIDFDLKCDRVPLAGLPLDWPQMFGRSLAAGRLNGGLRVHRGWSDGGWHIGLDGDIADLQLVTAGRPAWKIGRLALAGANLSTGDGAWSASRVQLADADLALSSFPQPPDQLPATIPEVKQMEIRGMRVRVLLADGSTLLLPELQGSGSLGMQGYVSLASLPVDADLADGAPGEGWKMQLQGDVLSDWQAQITGTQVPIVRLRPLLPELVLPGEQGVPEYSGAADFSVHLAPVASGLRMTGHVALHDVNMLQGGDQLHAALIDVDIDDADSAGKRQLSRVAVKEWHYQMALHPLARITRSAQAAEVARSVGALQPAVSLPSRVAGKASTGAGAAPAGPDASPLEPKQSAAPSPAGTGAQQWEVGELQAEGGRLSLGQPDALIAKDVLLRVHHLQGRVPAAFSLSGEFGGGSLHARGKLQLQPRFELSTQARVRNALPFVFNDWMQLSGMPRFVRGRFDAGLAIKQEASGERYRGHLDIGLHQAALEEGSFTEDPMPQRTGFTTRGLLGQLDAAHRVSLSIPFHGAWGEDRVVDRLGEAGLQVLKKQAAAAGQAGAQEEPPVVKLTRLRLQGKRGFSHNERVRLRRMARVLLHDKSLIVELAPQLGTTPLDAQLIQRVTYSQGLVERYLRRLGVGSNRIFPVWPQALDQHGDTPGLMLRARKP